MLIGEFVQGEDKDIPFVLYHNGQVITNTNVTDVKIRMANVEKSASYDSGRWIYHLSSDDSWKMVGSIPVNAEYKANGETYKSLIGYMRARHG